MKTMVTVLLSLLWISASAESPRPNTEQLVGEWVFDMTRFALHRMESKGIDIDAQMQSVESSFSDTKFQQNLPTLTITDTHLIFHEYAHNPERVQPYRIIGGNSAFAIVEYLDEDNLETVVHIYIDPMGISFANPSCETYMEQCERQKARFMDKFNAGTNTTIGGDRAMTSTTLGQASRISGVTHAIDESVLEKSWQEQLSTRVFFKLK